MKSRHNHQLVLIIALIRSHTFTNASVAAAQAAPLLPVPVQPHAEDHKHHPAGGADACDESRLLHHIRNVGKCVRVIYTSPNLARCVCKTVC